MNYDPLKEGFFFAGGHIGCLMIHGFGSSPGEMAGLGRCLHEAGYTVKGVVLQGHGTSPEDLATTRWPDWYRSVSESLQDLAQDCSQVWAVGLSLGGALSLYAASQGLVDGVVALAAPAGLADWRARFAGFGKYFMPYQRRRFSPKQQELNERTGRLVYDRLPLAAVESLYQFIGVVRKCLPLVRVPTLVVHSAKDEVVAAYSGDYIFKHIASVQKEYLHLERSGHIITEDVEKELVCERVRNFLQRYAPLVK